MAIKYIIIACLTMLVASQRRRPNIILMVSDDQDVMLGSLRVMNHLRETIMQNGVEFSNAFTTTPICCPSRSSILTGLYAHNHNVFTNNDNCSSIIWQRYFESRSYATYLHDSGYFTGYFGKYLNEYNGSYTPNGWDYWMGLVKNSRYYNYTLLHNNRREFHGNNYAEDYLTDLVTNKSIEFFMRSKEEDPERPVLAVVSFPAPHGPEDAAPQYNKLYGDDSGHKTKSFDYVPNYDKHWIIRQNQQKMDADQMLFAQLLQQKRLQTLRSVDDGVKKIVDMLDEIRELDNTYLLYISDHGYHIGQFGIAKGKTMPYDFDIRIPFAMRGPGIPRNQTSRKIALNIDVAPTILGIAGVPVPPHMDGRNLLDVFSEERMANQPWRDSFLIERGKVTHNRTHLTKPRMKTKTEKLQKVCGSANYVSPCQPGQYWTCVTENQKLRLQKCKKPVKAKAKSKRRNRCPCPPNHQMPNDRKAVTVQDYCGKRGFLSPNNKIPRVRGRNGHRLQKRMLRDAYMRNMQKQASSSYNKLRKERRYRRSNPMRHSTGSPFNSQRSGRSMSLTSKCRLYMPNFEIRCRRDLYNDPKLWMKHMGYVARAVRTLQIKMQYMKTLQTCLTYYYTKNPNRWCDCSQMSTKPRTPKMNITHPLDDETEVDEREFQEKQRIFEEQREINKALKETKQAKLLRKQRRNLRTGGESKRCGSKGLTCFVLSNRTWNTEPRWQGDSHCYCTNSNNNTYWCVRIINDHTDALYCQFITGFREYFNLKEDPYQLVSTEMYLENEEKMKYQEMIKSLRSCKGYSNCTLPPFSHSLTHETGTNQSSSLPNANATDSNQSSSNSTAENIQRSLDFDQLGSPQQIAEIPQLTTSSGESQERLDITPNPLDVTSPAQTGRGKSGQRQVPRVRGLKLKGSKARSRKNRKSRLGTHRRADIFMPGRGTTGVPGRAGHSNRSRKPRLDIRRRSRVRPNRRI